MPCLICGDPGPEPGELCQECLDRAHAIRDRFMTETGCTEDQLIKVVRQHARRQRLIEEAMRRFDENHKDGGDNEKS